MKYFSATGRKKGGSKPLAKRALGETDANINTHDGSSPEREKRDSDRNNDGSLNEYYQVTSMSLCFNVKDSAGVFCVCDLGHIH